MEVTLIYVVVSARILVAVTDEVTLLFGLVLCMARHQCCRVCVWLALVHNSRIVRPEERDDKLLSGFAVRAAGTEQPSRRCNWYLPVPLAENAGQGLDTRATSLRGRTLCTFETDCGEGNGFHRKAAF